MIGAPACQRLDVIDAFGRATTVRAWVQSNDPHVFLSLRVLTLHQTKPHPLAHVGQVVLAVVGAPLTAALGSRGPVPLLVFTRGAPVPGWIGCIAPALRRSVTQPAVVLAGSRVLGVPFVATREPLVVITAWRGHGIRIVASPSAAKRSRKSSQVIKNLPLTPHDSDQLLKNQIRRAVASTP